MRPARLFLAIWRINAGCAYLSLFISRCSLRLFLRLVRLSKLETLGLFKRLLALGF